MFKILLFVFALLLAGMMTLHTTLQNGSLVRYMDRHPNPSWVPAAEFYIGQGYYLKHDLTNAATYFIRVSDGYPTSSYADDAYFTYLECLDNGGRFSHAQMAEEYQKYLDRFPDGLHAKMARNRIGAYKTGV